MDLTKKTKPSHYAVKSCSLPCAVKDVDPASRTVTGFYNTYLFLDSDGDVILPGAAKRSIKNNGPKSNATAKIKHALNHNLTQLPGKIMVLEERTIGDVEGIYFETRMADTQLGNDTLKNYDAGIYDNHSIGFRYIMDKLTMIERESKAAWDRVVERLINPEEAETRTYLWTVGEIKLFEGSTVAFGANSLTPFLGMAKAMTKESIMKSMNDRLDLLEAVAKTGSQSDDMIQTIEGEFMKMRQFAEDLSAFINIHGVDAAMIKRFEQEQKHKNEQITGPQVIGKIDLSKW